MFVATVSGAFVCLAALLAELNGYTATLLVRDPAASFDFPPFVGMISNIGISIMVATAAICTFASTFRGATLAPLLRIAGIFTCFVAVDDLFMLHERRGMIAGAVPDYIIFPLYIIFGLWLMGRIFHAGRTGHMPTLIFAGALLLGSMVTDMTLPQHRATVMIEDALKFMGYSVWALYWIGLARRALHPPASAHI
ncbi:hypothetical protein ACW9UR_12295 [Halovulum sp. GXIMD14794]